MKPIAIALLVVAGCAHRPPAPGAHPGPAGLAAVPGVAAPAIPDDLQMSLDGALSLASDPSTPLPLLIAAAGGDVAAVTRLIDQNADVDAAPDPLDNDFSWTPLMAARAKNHVEIVARLEAMSAREACHIVARAARTMELRPNAHHTGEVVATLAAGTRLVITTAKGRQLDVAEYAPGTAFAHSIEYGDAHAGWTSDPVSPELDGEARLAPHPYGPWDQPTVAVAPLRVIGCHAYSARVVDARGHEGWVRAAHGPGWGG